MRPTHVPVEIFRFHIKREHVCQNRVHRSCDVLGCGRCEIGPRSQWSVAPSDELLGFLRRIGFLHDFRSPALIMSGFGSRVRAESKYTFPMSPSNKTWWHLSLGNL